MADRNHLLLCLALGSDAAKRVEQLPKQDEKSQAAIIAAKRRGTVNRPGRS